MLGCTYVPGYMFKTVGHTYERERGRERDGEGGRKGRGERECMNRVWTK